MSSIDSTIVATALRSLTRELHTSIAWSSWTITAYLLGQTIAMPLTGRLSDSLGRRGTFLAFVAVFTVASLCSGLAPNVFVLVAFRFVQALGGGGFMPSASGAVADRFGRDRDRAIGLFSSVFPLGAIIGPALGGFIVSYWSWRWIFFINVPVGLLLLVLLRRLLPGSAPTGTGRVDVAGAALMTGGLLSLMLGLNRLGDQGAGAAAPWLLLALALAFAAGFLLHEGTARSPILPPALLRRRAFAVVNSLNLLYGAAAFGVFSFVPLFAQVAYGMAPLQAGLLLTARAAGMILIAVAASLTIRRTGYRAPMAGGFVLVAAGLVTMALGPRLVSPFAWLALSSLLCGVGVGLAGPASNNAALQLMPDHVAGITGLRGMFRQVGGIVSISLIALAIGQGSSEGSSLRRVFVVVAGLAVAGLPAIVGVPETTAEKARPVPATSTHTPRSS
jgi:EmrB/QacA subfamily drug resistance transporter